MHDHGRASRCRNDITLLHGVAGHNVNVSAKLDGQLQRRRIAIQGCDAPATLNENSRDLAANAAGDSENECDRGVHGLTCCGCVLSTGLVLATGAVKGIA
jgi:hypothetical protein